MDSASSCEGCGRNFPTIAGLADLRLRADRYLSLGAERAKAERLDAMADDHDLARLAEAYYAMTDDVDAGRRKRFLSHIARAEARGRELARLLPKSGRVLEIGCGTGGLLVAASRQGVQIEGVDVASRWLVLAQKRMDACGLNVPVWIANAEHLPWPAGTFHAVVADSLVEHLDDPLPRSSNGTAWSGRAVA